MDFRVPRSLETKVIAPSRGYQQRMARPLGVGGESESRRQREMTREEESMRLAQERLSSTVGMCLIVYNLIPDYTLHICTESVMVSGVSKNNI